MLEYLTNCLSTLEANHASSGVILLGDLNQLNTSRLSSNFGLKQTVNFGTRGANTLDKVLTNLQHFYDSPQKRPGFGLSDHFSVEVKPKQRSNASRTKQKITSRDMRPTNRLAMRTYLEQVNVAEMIKSASPCVDKTSLLQLTIKTGLDAIMPERTKYVQTSGPRWINPSLKRLIAKRQAALHNGDTTNFRRLRNKVNRERKVCRANFYKRKVESLKNCSPSVWWKEIKKLGSMSNPDAQDRNILNSLHHLEGTTEMSSGECANHINRTFLSPMEKFEPLSDNPGFQMRSSEDPVVLMTEMSAFKKLVSLNPLKAHGSDEIPGWLLKENADLLTIPICDIINCSYQEGRLPSAWKEANVIPVPKQRPIKDVNKHLRPISLTPIISKIAEEHIVETYIKPAVLDILDPQQFGAIPKSSSTQALISLLHKMYVSTDGNGAANRVVLLDFRKAFDLINHNILVEKLLTLNLPNQVVCWIIDFLMFRKQRTKLSNECYSEWLYVRAGVPQGTKLGPWLFLLMVNELHALGLDVWKFVDDITVLEVVPKGDHSHVKDAIDSLSVQSLLNDFELNEAKCKELRICFSKSPPNFDPVEINGKPLELVTSARILGLNVSSDLKWNVHVNQLVKKVSSRLYCFRQLKRSAVAPKDLIIFYITCIRSLLEYACPVFHRALPGYLSDDLERLQRRALRIIFPSLSYSGAIVESGLTTLYQRREEISQRTFNELANDNEHKLYHLLPIRSNINYATRHQRKFNLPRVKTERCKNSFIISHIYK